MRKVDVFISGDGDATRRIAATLFLPDPATLTGCVIFASPGGGYGRGYYDLKFAGREGYSQAEHHVARGIIFVAYDHLGVGDSSIDALDHITIEEIAAVDHEAVSVIARRLREGSAAEGFPAVSNLFSVGIGQSMGGGVSIIMQGRHRCFDAVGVLGYSAIHTVLPQRTEESRARGIASYQFSRETAAETLSVTAASSGMVDFVYPFHWEDVPADILKADMDGGYPVRHSVPAFGSGTIPNCVVAMMSPGFVKEEAAAVDVPVLLAYGERDVSMDMHAEPGAFPASRDVSLFIAPTMAHMHNFASTRALLWDRIADWSLMVAGAARAA